jgi:Icc protein
MDAFYSLHDMETVQRELTQIKNLHHIFTGHYHAAMHAMFNGINVYVTPSTHLQLDNHGSEFKISSLQPAWRLIEWGTGSLKTSVHFL